jgi:hypothetical protein
LANTLARESVRVRAIHQAEKLEAEATRLETVSRAVRH